jgi:hypothetical protein
MDPIAQSNLEIADALRAIAAALAPKVEPKHVVMNEPEPPSLEDIADLTAQETNLAFLIRKVDEDSGYSNIFTEEAILLAKEILKEYEPITDMPVGPPVTLQITAAVETAVASERERIANAFADFWQMLPYDNWRSKSGRRYEDLGNGRTVGYDLAKDVINGTAADHLA